MESYEAKTAQATARESRYILGAIGIVFDAAGKTLYHNASGYQSLAPDAPSINPDSTFEMASAGKFITHIAALQCVDRGLVTLDDPVYPHLPELENLNVLSKSPTGEFRLERATKQITLRHLLSHSSGIDYESNATIKEWRATTPAGTVPEYQAWRSLTYNPSEPYTKPLLFEPGEGWIYGASIELTQLLVWRLTQVSFGKHVYDSVFKPLGMTSTTYHPERHSDICERALQMVEREGDDLVPVEGSPRGLVSSMPDLVKLFADLLSPKSKVLMQEHVRLLFEPQFPPGSAALKAIRNDTGSYAPAGIPPSMKEPAINHSLAALVIEEEMPLSKMPAGTVTWDGMPNLIWCVHRDRGLGMVFMTQLLPVHDGKTVDLAMEFFRGAWARFG